jgi:diacylglycerol O-acyltransferase / wax synthase
VERLTSIDAAFLYMESPTTPMHVGAIALLERPARGVDVDRLVAHIGTRIVAVPRLTQKVRDVPLHLANPVWVDDDQFDLDYHLRRSALPSPGGHGELLDLAARVLSRPLDRARPLWELYVVEGLAGGRLALISKTHSALVDGTTTVDVLQLVLDARPVTPSGTRPRVPAARATSSSDIVAGAVTELVRRPGLAVDALRGSVADLRGGLSALGSGLGSIASLARTAVRSAPPSALNPEIGATRSIGTAQIDLALLRGVRAAHGCSVNDAVLAVVAGALRALLLSRGEPVTAATTLRALVPVSVTDSGSRRIAPFLVDLPVGEPNPVVRLAQIGFAMSSHAGADQTVAAEALVAAAGFSPPTTHALAARVASTFSRRLFNVAVINVPGPQRAMYVGRARLAACYPVVPLARSQSVAVAVTSYAGVVFAGVTADKGTFGDAAPFATMIEEAAAELAASV